MPYRTLTVAAVAWLLTGCGITGNFRDDPGYAAFGSPGSLATQREFGLSLGPLPLKVARWALDDDPEIGPLLKDLRAVRVYVYQVVQNGGGVAQRVDEMQSELSADGWVTLIAIREDDSLTSVLLRPADGGRNHGLAVIVQDPADVVLVNLIGNVRLDLFNDYMAELDVDAPPLEIDATTLQARIQ